MHDLTNIPVAILLTNEFEDSELSEPLKALKEAGASVTIVSDQIGSITGKNGTEIMVDAQIKDVTHDDFRGLVLPGGVGNPDTLRMNEKAVSFTRSFFGAHKPVAAICHAPWLLIEAGVVDGRTVTSWPSLKTDLTNAGANWVDEEVVTDQGLVTSRNPDDLPAFCEKMLEELAEGKHEAQTT